MDEVVRVVRDQAARGADWIKVYADYGAGPNGAQVPTFSLEELKALVEAEDARAALRREWQGGVEDPVRRREILDESLGHIGRQLELVRRRRDEIASLEAELLAKRRRVQSRRRELTPS